MASEWYLMNKNRDPTIEFESDDLKNSAGDTFKEVLNSVIGTDVEICNPDLSERIPQRVIIQGNVKDTKLNSMQRYMLSPVGICKAGQYVYYKEHYWLIIGFVDGTILYDKAVLIICNYLLSWINSDNYIVQRWVNVASASQYNNGETSNAFYFIKSDQLMVLTPQDDECLLMKHKQRFIIDKRCIVYEKTIADDVIKDTSNIVNTYELTRLDSVLFDYGNSGHSEFMAYQCEQEDDDGFYRINGSKYWLCNGSIDNIIEKSNSYIDCEVPIIYNSLEATVFSPKFINSAGDIDDTVMPVWTVNCDFISDLDIEYVGKNIVISANNERLINKEFELILTADGYPNKAISITIQAFL